MKVYIVFQGSAYPYSNGDIVGVFREIKDAEDMLYSLRSEDAFIEEQDVIE